MHRPASSVRGIPVPGVLAQGHGADAPATRVRKEGKSLGARRPGRGPARCPARWAGRLGAAVTSVPSEVLTRLQGRLETTRSRGPGSASSSWFLHHFQSQGLINTSSIIQKSFLFSISKDSSLSQRQNVVRNLLLGSETFSLQKCFSAMHQM